MYVYTPQCIVLYDYDPEKMSPSDNPQLELKIVEGNLLRCYTRDDNELSSDFTMAEVCCSAQSPSAPANPSCSWLNLTREVWCRLISSLKCTDLLLPIQM